MRIPGLQVDVPVENGARIARGAVKAATQAIGLGGFDDAVERIIRGTREDVSGGAVGSVSGRIGGISASALGGLSLSQWGLLSPHLIANLFAVNFDNVEIESEGRIKAPITDANIDMTLNWQSPFENAGPESKAPALMALVQSGQIGKVVNDLKGIAPEFAQKQLSNATQFSNDLQGKTGITKLNSRQVFSGMPPVKITMTMHFRAVSDAQLEVMAPYQKLLEWALPQKLAEDGAVNQLLQTGSVVNSMFPSDAPQMIGFIYGNNRYSPMVIEHVSNPIDGPMDRNGLPLYRAVQVSLATLTALDRNDVKTIFSRST